MSEYKLDEEKEEQLSDIYYYATTFSWNLPQEAMYDKWYYFWECLKGTTIYVILQAILLLFCIQIDKVISLDIRRVDNLLHEDYVGNILSPNTSLAANYQNAFYRTDREDSWIPSDRVYETTYFSLGMFLYFIFSQVIGFTFVNVVNLQSIRKNPFLTKNDEYTKWNPYIGTLEPYAQDKTPRYQDVQTCTLISVMMYFASGQMNLRNRYSMKGYCEQNVEHEICSENGILNDWQIFLHNFVWTIFFYVGLWFTHADQSFLGGISLTWDSIVNQWNLIQKITMPLVGAVIVSLLVYIIYLIWQGGWEYILFYAVYAASVIFVSVCLTLIYPKEETHYHHWFIFLLINTFCSHSNLLVTMVGAYTQGVFVEGCARWGLDPVWVQVDIPERLTEIRIKINDGLGLKHLDDE